MGLTLVSINHGMGPHRNIGCPFAPLLILSKGLEAKSITSAPPSDQREPTDASLILHWRCPRGRASIGVSQVPNALSASLKAGASVSERRGAQRLVLSSEHPPAWAAELWASSASCRGGRGVISPDSLLILLLPEKGTLIWPMRPKTKGLSMSWCFSFLALFGLGNDGWLRHPRILPSQHGLGNAAAHLTPRNLKLLPAKFCGKGQRLTFASSDMDIWTNEQAGIRRKRIPLAPIPISNLVKVNLGGILNRIQLVPVSLIVGFLEIWPVRSARP